MRLSEMPGHFATLRNGHKFVATARRVGFSASQARAISKAMQLARAPRELVARKRLATELLESVRPPVTIRDGYATFEAEDLPHGSAALAVSKEIADEEKAAYQPKQGEKGFLRSLFSPRTLRDRPEILDFATSRELVAVVTEYLGVVPTLSDVRLWWSVPSSEPSEPTSSQKFHRDHEDYRQVKVFLNVEEVTENAGPFTFLPAPLSIRIVKHLDSPVGRYEDEEVMRYVTADDLIVLTGPAGSAAMVDTCSCLHYGSRNETRERLLLMLHYVGFHSIVEPDQKVLTQPVRAARTGQDPVVDALMRTRPDGLR